MIIIGLGSPFLSDDSIGIRVVRSLQKLDLSGVNIVESHAGGLLLLEELDGHSSAIIVDALLDSSRKPGEIVITTAVNATNSASCSHDCSLQEALELGRNLGMNLPANDCIILIGVVVFDVTTVSEKLSPPVEAALKDICDVVVKTAKNIVISRCYKDI